MKFKDSVTITQVSLMFQGGFSSRIARLVFMDHEEKELMVHEINPEDHNSSQSFPIEPVTCNCFKVVFQDFCDFYARIILYNLQVYGHIMK